MILLSLLCLPILDQANLIFCDEPKIDLSSLIPQMIFIQNSMAVIAVGLPKFDSKWVANLFYLVDKDVSTDSPIQKMLFAFSEATKLLNTWKIKMNRMMYP